MTEPSTDTVTRADALLVLIVDDDAPDRKLIKESLDSIPWIVCRECKSLADVERLGSTEVFDVCILDVKFGDVTDIWGLLNIVEQRFSRAIVIIISNYLDELKQKMPPGVVARISKPSFKSDRSLLRTPLIKNLRQNSTLDPLLRQAVVAHLEDLNEREQSEQEELLVEMTGYVVEVRRPFVQVVVEEPPTILDRLTQLVRKKEPPSKQLLMSCKPFEAIGILAPDMPFRLRVVRRRNKTISAVLPIEEKSPVAGPETPKMGEDLDRLRALQAAKRKQVGLDNE